MLYDLLFWPVAVAYVAILLVLFTYGINFLWLTWVAIRSGPAGPPAPTPARWPAVTVQLPIYNEMYVAERLIDTTSLLDYPGELEIQVLDDSTDDTVDIAAAAVARKRAQGVRIEHVRRGGRLGFKAGALAHGLSLARGEYVAIFDADFIPPADFLTRAVPVLVADPKLAFVQTRWGHANREFSLLTHLQSLWIDGHMAIEQFGRWRSGQWFNFNGSGGVWRREALEDAGGWTPDTLTEDLDVSYRAFLRGWRAAFLRDLECPAELPVSYAALRRQQHRWARGSFECAMKHLANVWRSPVPRRRKLQATLHLLGYSIHVQMLALVLLYPLVLLVASRHPELLTLIGAIGVFNLAAVAPTTLFTAAQQQLGRRWWRAIPMVLLLTVLGAGLMVNTTAAALEAVRRRPGTFERTPKFGLGREKVEWQRLGYQPRLDPIVLGESAVATICVWTAFQAVQAGIWAIAAYAALFALGLGFSVALTLIQSTRGVWAARARERARISAPGS